MLFFRFHSIKRGGRFWKVSLCELKQLITDKGSYEPFFITESEREWIAFKTPVGERGERLILLIKGQSM